MEIFLFREGNPSHSSKKKAKTCLKEPSELSSAGKIIENQYELLSAWVTVSTEILIYFPSYNLRETGHAGRVKEMRNHKLSSLRCQILRQISWYSVQKKDQAHPSFNNCLSLSLPSDSTIIPLFINST